MTNSNTIEDRYNRAVIAIQKAGVLFTDAIPAAVLSNLEAAGVKVAYHSVDGTPVSWKAGKPVLTTEEGSASISRIDVRFAHEADKTVAKELRKQDFIVDDSEAGVLKVALV